LAQSGVGDEEGTSLFDEDQLSARQETSLLSVPQKGHGAINGGGVA